MRKTGATGELRRVSRLWLSWRGWNAGSCSSGAEIWRRRCRGAVDVAKLEEEEKKERVMLLDFRDEILEKKPRRLMLAFRESWGVDSGEGPLGIPMEKEPRRAGSSEVPNGEEPRRASADRGVLDGVAGWAARSLPSLPFRTLRARDDVRQDLRRRCISRAS